MAGPSRIAEAYVQLIPSLKGFGAALATAINTDPSVRAAMASVGSGSNGVAATAAGQSTGNSVVQGFGKGLKRMAAVAVSAALVAGAAAAGVIYHAVGNASDLEQAVGAVEQVFGNSSQAIIDFAETAATSFGLSKRAALDASKDIGIFGSSAGLAGEDLTVFTTDLLSLSADLSAFGNTSPEEALTALSAGLRGESEPLRKYGILLDDATLKARAMEMGIFDGVGTLTQQQRILAAQQEIMGQSTTQMGQFARESGGLAGQQAILAAQLENSSAKLGAIFMPLFVSFFTWMNTTGIPILDNIIGKIGDLFAGADGMTNPFSGMEGGLGTIVDLFTTLSPLMLIWDALVANLPLLQEAFMPLGEVLINTVIPAIAEIAALLAPLAAEIITALSEVLIALMPIIVTLLELLTPIVVFLVELLVPILVWLVDFIADGLVKNFEQIAPVIEGLVMLIGMAIQGWAAAIVFVWNLIAEMINGIDIPIPDWAQGFFDGQTSIGGFNLPTFPIPTMPALAQGANIAATAGGTAVIVGEAGRAETVTDYGQTNAFIQDTRALVNQVREQATNNGDIYNIELHQQPGESMEEFVERFTRYLELRKTR